jgi:hypothetical protein
LNKIEYVLYVKLVLYTVFLSFTKALCNESDGRSTSNVLMLMLYWTEKIIRNSMYLHKTNNRHTLITVFCFRVDPPLLLWKRMRPRYVPLIALRNHAKAAAPPPYILADEYIRLILSSWAAAISLLKYLKSDRLIYVAAYWFLSLENLRFRTQFLNNC